MNILLIEDDSLYAQTISHLLDGLNISVANTLGAARELLHEHPFQLILVDLGLPDSQGLDTLHALTPYRAPKVVVTSNHDVIEEAAKLGVVDYIVKSADTVDIFERIMFNVNKLKRRTRFAPEAFQQIQACLSRCELAVA